MSTPQLDRLTMHCERLRLHRVQAELSTLLTLSDSRLPTGGHVHSGGVEEAVTSGLVVDLDTLRAFLRRRIR